MIRFMGSTVTLLVLLFWNAPSHAQILPGCTCDCDANGSGGCELADNLAVQACAQDGLCDDCADCDINCDGVVDEGDMCAINCMFAEGINPECCNMDRVGACCTAESCQLSCANGVVGSGRDLCVDAGETYFGDDTTCALCELPPVDPAVPAMSGTALVMTAILMSCAAVFLIRRRSKLKIRS